MSLSKSLNLVAAFLGAFNLPAQTYQVMIPSCCAAASSAVFVLNPKNGNVEQVLNTGVQDLSGYGVGAIGLATLKNGTLAVLSQVGVSFGVANSVVSLINPISGKLLGSLTISGSPGSIGVNPESGVLYVSYYPQPGQPPHLQEINPSTLTAIADEAVTGAAFLVSPQRIYLAGDQAVDVYSASTLVQVGSISGPTMLIGLSPDSSTLYSSSNVTDELLVVDTATLEITQTISLTVYGINPTNVTIPSAISPDGTKLFMDLSSELLTIDTSTFAGTTTPLPDNDFSYPDQFTVGGNGTAFVVAEGQNGWPAVALTFDTATLAFTGQIILPPTINLASDPDGSKLYALAEASSISVLGPPPSTSILLSGLAGQSYLNYQGTVDAKSNLFLLSDSNGNVEVVNGSTLKLEGLIPAGGSGPILYTNAGYLATVVQTGGYSVQAEVLEFAPETLKVTATLPIPTPVGGYYSGLTQIAASGDLLYVPYYFTPDVNVRGDSAGDLTSSHAGIAVVNTTSFKLADYIPLTVATITGFALKPNSTMGYLTVTTYAGQAELIEVDLSTGELLATVSIPSGGFLVQAPGASTLYAGGSELLAINEQTLEVSNSVPTSCSSLAITPDDQYLYCSGESEVDILSTSTLQTVGVIPSPSSSPGAALVIPQTAR